jgi:uncharacterized protein YndB with AHSA1/START domain
VVKGSAQAAADSAAANNTADREIVITRLIDAPRELVFRAWTDSKQVGKWWGPTGFTTTTHEIDIKPGGAWRFIMHGPDGTDWDNEILYREVVKPERLVYDHGDPGTPGQHFKVWVTFDEEAGKTRLTLRTLFESAAARDYVVREVKAIEGGNQTLDRFEAFVATM